MKLQKTGSRFTTNNGHTSDLEKYCLKTIEQKTKIYGNVDLMGDVKDIDDRGNEIAGSGQYPS